MAKRPLSVRSYKRVIARLKQTIANMQWVRPTYNGADSCASCGEMRHHGCSEGCEAAAITGDCGEPEPE